MKYTYKGAFSIIELLVGIFIFSLGLISIYAIIISTLRINDFNSNYIVAVNLAKEQNELIKNIRDSNYQKLKPFDLKNPNGNSFTATDKLELQHYYKIENNLGTNVFPVSLEDITTGFVEGKENLNSPYMQAYRLCITLDNVYTYDCLGDNKKTEYYRFFYVDKLEAKAPTGVIDNAYKITSKVIWFKRGYHEYKINTVLADWKRL